jgi:hypothetical protein
MGVLHATACAGLLHALCAEGQAHEQVLRAKASGAGGASCCQVLHACLANADAVPRHVVLLLAALSATPQGVPVLLKALLAAGGGVPWRAYAGVLDASHAREQDHTSAIAMCSFLTALMSGVSVAGQRQVLKNVHAWRLLSACNNQHHAWRCV